MNKYMEKGISLISLIISIIVIIILATIVIFSGLDTPNKANFARFTQEFINYSEAILNDFTSRKAKYSVNGTILTDEQIYYLIANGIKDNIDINLIPNPTGLISDLGIKIRPENLKGEKYFRITSDSNISGIKNNKKFFADNEEHYITDKGEVFFLPGYLVEDNGNNRWYINERLFYFSEDDSSGGIKLSDTYKVGDYVDYTPKESIQYTPLEEKTGIANETLETDMDLKWRIIGIDDANSKLYITPGIVHSSPKIFLFSAVGYYTGFDELNTICDKLYSNSDKGLIATNMTINDINMFCNYTENITEGYKYYRDSSELTEGDIVVEGGISYTCSLATGRRRFFTGIGGEDSTWNDVPYHLTTIGNPVLVKRVCYSYSFPNSTIADIIDYQGTDGWIASPSINPTSGIAEYGTFYIGENGVNYKRLVTSKSIQESTQGRIIPLICVDASKLTGEGTGEITSPWGLR